MGNRDLAASGQVRVQSRDVGDLVAVLAVGAYGFAGSMPLFLARPIPPEVVVRNVAAALIRPRQKPGECLSRQILATMYQIDAQEG